MISAFVIFLASALFFAFVGSFVAEKYGRSQILGLIVGGVFHFVGVFVLWIALAIAGPKTAQ